MSLTLLLLQNLDNAGSGPAVSVPALSIALAIDVEAAQSITLNANTSYSGVSRDV